MVKPTIIELYEKRLSDKDKMIDLLEKEVKVLRTERKRLLDYQLTPISYDGNLFGKEISSSEFTEKDAYDLQAGTIIDGGT